MESWRAAAIEEFSTCVDLSGIESGIDLLPVSKPPSNEIGFNHQPTLVLVSYSCALTNIGPLAISRRRSTRSDGLQWTRIEIHQVPRGSDSAILFVAWIVLASDDLVKWERFRQTGGQ